MSFSSVLSATTAQEELLAPTYETVEQPGHLENAATVRERRNEEIGEDNVQEDATSFQQREIDEATPISTPVSQMHIAQRTRARIAARRSSGAERNRVRRSQETTEARHQRLAEMRERYRRRRQPRSEERGEEDLMQEVSTAGFLQPEVELMQEVSTLASLQREVNEQTADPIPILPTHIVSRSRATATHSIAAHGRHRHGQEVSEAQEALFAPTHGMVESPRHRTNAATAQRRNEEIGEDNAEENATTSFQHPEMDEAATSISTPISQMHTAHRIRTRIAARRSSGAERNRVRRSQETTEARHQRLAEMRERYRRRRQPRSEERGEEDLMQEVSTVASLQREMDEPIAISIPILQMHTAQRSRARVAATLTSTAANNRLRHGQEAPETEEELLAPTHETVEHSTQHANAARNLDRRHRPLPNTHVSEHYLGEMNVICLHCGAALFSAEVPSGRNRINICCNFGNIVLEDKFADFPAELHDLFVGDDELSSNFRRKARQFNSALAMASMGAKIDLPAGHGPWVFKIHGQIYHYAGPLHPASGIQRSYGQLYILDTAQAAAERLGHPANAECDPDVMHMLSTLMYRVNPFAQSYKMMADVLEEEEAAAARENRSVAPIRMVFETSRSLDLRRYNAPICNEVAVVYVGENGDVPAHRDFAVYPYGEALQRISDISNVADPLCYPLFFPTGKLGWNPNLKKRDQARRRTRISQREYYCYLLQVRPGKFNPVHFGGPLTQQFIVDAWAKTEQNRLNYIRSHQADLRADAYQSLADFVSTNDGNHGPPGKRIILPATIKGSPRSMLQDYQDAMTIVARYGKPDFFVTFTCNPKWREIEESLQPGQTATDRPDMIARVYKLKFDALMKLLLTEHILGRVIGYVSVFEWQKRGLPHTHSLFIMDTDSNPRTAADVDRLISATIPDPAEDPALHEIVTTLMMHRPCGVHNPESPCMRDGRCSKKFPKEFCDSTDLQVNGYPKYRRPNDGHYVMCNNVKLDNRHVVPYNAFLSKTFNAHINVEICSLMEAVKYLYKYVYKGHDAASIRLSRLSITQNTDGHVIDEIAAHLDMRYVCAPEAMHHILEYRVEKKSHSIYRLAVHLPQEQQVTFRAGEEQQAAQRAAARHTTLTAWFMANTESEATVNSAAIPSGFLGVRRYLYTEMPTYFAFKNGTWTSRCRGHNQLGRMYTVSPRETERYALRQLLLHVRGAKSFEHLRTVVDVNGNSVIHSTFYAAAVALGLFDDDDSHVATLQEAALFATAVQMRAFFVSVLAFMEVKDPALLWNSIKGNLIEDYLHEGMSEEEAIAAAYYDLEERLIKNNINIASLNIPAPTLGRRPMTSVYDPVVCRAEGNRLYGTLNSEQKDAVDMIIGALENPDAPRLFFIDGPGGSGKTWTYTCLFNIFIGRGLKVACTAWTGIAANLLPSGRTSASLFKLDIKKNCETSSHKRQMKDARLLAENDIIIWDEASMIPKTAFETVDTVLRDITQVQKPFGGKMLILGGDFRQILPVIRRGSRVDQLSVCIKQSFLWQQFTTLRLSANMRVTTSDSEWTNFILRVGDGSANDCEGRVNLPMEVMGHGDIVNELYGNFIEPSVDLSNQAILAPKNADVNSINEQVLLRMQGEEKVYYSHDEIVTEDANDQVEVYTTEFLNKIATSSLPPHCLRLKEGAIVMLLRNLDVSSGLCNGTRLRVCDMGRRVIRCKFITGDRRGQTVLIPKIYNYDDKDLPFKLRRSQFPIRLAFAMSINKSQGQSFTKVGLWLPTDVFSHGQLYVALSRVRSREGLIVQVANSNPLNVVFSEVL